MKLANTTDGFGEYDAAAGILTVRWSTADAYFFGQPDVKAVEVPLSSVDLLPPVPRPGKIFGVGLNYRAHAEEAGMEIPAVPILFAKWANSVVGPGQTVRLPTVTTQPDYEAELAVVIGSTCRSVPPGRALDHVAGYTCANDVSARDLQFQTGQWLRGKAIDGFLPLGPWLVTRDEIGDPQRLDIRCWVDGELRQKSNTSDMIFGVAELVSFISEACTLEAGDVIITGTPFGVGMGFDPPRWIESGSQVTVEIEKIGRLTNSFL